MRAKRVQLVAALVFVCLCAPLAQGASVSVPDSTEQRIPFKKSDDTIGGMLGRVVGSLVVVAILGVGVVYLLKRYLPSLYHPTFAGASRINVLEIRRLTPKTTLFLIEVDGAHLLLGQHGDRITTLYERPNAAAMSDDAKK